MSRWLQPDILARAEALGYAAQQLVEGLRVGDHKSPYRGFSVEFVQHREYVPGDDIKHIDWKSYARSDRYTLKQYEQETNLVAHLLVDSSNSMRYGDGTSNKYDYTKLLAASLAYLVVKQRDSVSLRLVDARWRAERPSGSQFGHVRLLCELLESAQAEDKTSIGPLLPGLAEQLGRRGVVILLSDGLEELEPLLKGLQALRFRGHEVILMQVLHRDELEFPLDGSIRFIDLEGSEAFLARPAQLRPAYLRAIQEYLDQLERRCRQTGIDYLRLVTDQPLGPALAGYLIRRMQKSGRAAGGRR